MRRSTWLRNAAFMRQRRIVSCARGRNKERLNSLATVQDEFKNRRTSRSNEAEVFFAAKSASLRRRLPFLITPWRNTQPSTSCLHVVAPQHAMVPDVKPAVGDHGIGPCLLHLVCLLLLVKKHEFTFIALVL